MASRVLKALGCLLFAGFLGGFFLTSGSARYFKAAPQVVAEEPEDEGKPIVTPVSKTGNKHGGAQESDQEQKPADALTGPAKRKKPHDAKDVPDQDLPDDPGDEPTAPPADTLADLSGDQALRFLAGNTIEIPDPDGVKIVHRYMSIHGWQGDKDGSTVLVHRWVWKTNRLCEITIKAALDCQEIVVKLEKTPKKATGSLLGQLFFPVTQARFEVLRGNPAGVPERIPLIEGITKVPHDHEARTPSATGQAAVTALLGHSLLTEGSREVRASSYQPDGDWIEAKPLAHDKSKAVWGVRLSIGHWDFSDGVLCQERPGLELSRECFKPEQWGPASFRLFPASPGPVRTLSLLADANTP